MRREKAADLYGAVRARIEELMQLCEVVRQKMKAALVLMAYGSPSRPEDVGDYLRDIRGGRPVRDEAVAELEERYRRIGGGSPLNEITERQRAALEAERSAARKSKKKSGKKR